jgi:hypothetical protein
MKVSITLKDVYGSVKAYPACGNAHLFADMVGTKTLTASALISIARLGYDIELQDRLGGRLVVKGWQDGDFSPWGNATSAAIARLGV